MTNENEEKDVTKILSADHLSWYIRGYAPDFMEDSAEKSTIEAYPRSESFVRANSQTFYAGGGPLTAAQRELNLIAALATGPKPLFLAIHIYWGLCVELSPDQIASSILLAGMYEGISTYSSAIAIMQTTMTALEMLATHGKDHESYKEHRKVPSKDVIPVLKDVFAPPPKILLQPYFPHWFPPPPPP